MVFSYLMTICLFGYVSCHILLCLRPIALACALPRARMREQAGRKIANEKYVVF